MKNEPFLAESRRAAECLAAARDYFDAPTPEGASRARELAAGLGRGGREAFLEHLREAALHAGRAVASASAYDAASGEAVRGMAEALAAAGDCLAAAVRERARPGVAARQLVRARQDAARAEQIYSRARPALSSSRRAVEALKTEDILRQLSLAADRADLAAAALADHLIKERA